MADLERPVLAREPRQRAGLGEGDLGAVAGIARGLARTRSEPNVPGGRKTTWPSDRCGASAARDVGLRGRGRRAHDQLGAAHRRGDVGSDRATGCASCRPRKSLTRIAPPAARCAATAARRAATAAPRGPTVPGHRPLPKNRCHRPARQSASVSLNFAGGAARTATLSSGCDAAPCTGGRPVGRTRRSGTISVAVRRAGKMQGAVAVSPCGRPSPVAKLR